MLLSWFIGCRGGSRSAASAAGSARVGSRLAYTAKPLAAQPLAGGAAEQDRREVVAVPRAGSTARSSTRPRRRPKPHGRWAWCRRVPGWGTTRAGARGPRCAPTAEVLSSGAMRWVVVVEAARGARADALPVGQVADESPPATARARGPPRMTRAWRPGAAVDGAGQAHDAGAVLARPVRDGRHRRAVAPCEAEREDEALMRGLGRGPLGTLARCARLTRSRRRERQRAAQAPVAMHASRARGLDDEVRRLVAQQPPDHQHPQSGSVHVDPQPVGVGDVPLARSFQRTAARQPRLRPRQFGDEREDVEPARSPSRRRAGSGPASASGDPQLPAGGRRPRRRSRRTRRCRCAAGRCHADGARPRLRPGAPPVTLVGRYGWSSPRKPAPSSGPLAFGEDRPPCGVGLFNADRMIGVSLQRWCVSAPPRGACDSRALARRVGARPARTAVRARAGPQGRCTAASRRSAALVGVAAVQALVGALVRPSTSRGAGWRSVVMSRTPPSPPTASWSERRTDARKPGDHPAARKPSSSAPSANRRRPRHAPRAQRARRARRSHRGRARRQPGFARAGARPPATRRPRRSSPAPRPAGRGPGAPHELPLPVAGDVAEVLVELRLADRPRAVAVVQLAGENRDRRLQRDAAGLVGHDVVRRPPISTRSPMLTSSRFGATAYRSHGKPSVAGRQIDAASRRLANVAHADRPPERRSSDTRRPRC